MVVDGIQMTPPVPAPVRVFLCPPARAPLPRPAQLFPFWKWLTPPSSKGLLYNLNAPQPAPTRTRTLIPAPTYHRGEKVAPGANLRATAVLRARARFGARLIARFGA